MPVPLANLRPTKEQIAKVAQAYASHRPLIQRGLTTGFVFYVLLATYNGLFGRAASAAKSRDKGKGKAKGGEVDPKKPPRVAVRARSPSDPCKAITRRTLDAGRRGILPAIINDPPNSHSEHTLERGWLAVHALESSHLPDCHLAVCGRARRKVRPGYPGLLGARY